jgi:hypothetical protein
LAAEARFTDLRLGYVSSGRAWNEPNGPINVAEATYTQKTLKNQKTPKRLRYQDLKVSRIDLEAEQSTLVWDTVACFDGEATMVLYRMVKSNEPIRGLILAGYDPNQFPTMDPHSKIWYFSNELLGDLLKKNRNTFRIESKSELLDELSTIKLVGTIWDGAATMKLWVSPERNFLPMKRQIVKTGGRLLSETALYNLVQLSNGMWYPKTIQSPAEPPGAPEPAWVQSYNISEISIDPIPKEFFSLKFPPGARILDTILDVSYTTY